MIFTKATEYGIKATIYIAQQSLNQKRPNLKEISKEIGSPEAFTAKVLQMLVKSDIVNSAKGANGGFSIELKKIKKIKLQKIVEALASDFDFKICVLGLKECSEINPCPVHNKYKYIKASLQDMLQSTNLFDLSTSLKNGETCLKF